MPLFSRKPKDAIGDGPDLKSMATFNCQLAHGSATHCITGFHNYSELYNKIAECYKLPVENILFCTLNTHTVDMTKLLSGGVGVNDLIFAHVKGRPKEVEIILTKPAEGLILTDNGAGYALIKRFNEGNVIESTGHIYPGDHIEKINDINVVGKRHFEVTRILMEIPPGAKLTLRVIEPMRCGFEGIGPRVKVGEGGNRTIGSGMATLHFKAGGNVTIEEGYDVHTKQVIMAINSLLATFLAIEDDELAGHLWELAASKMNRSEYAETLAKSDLEMFQFSNDFICQIWSVITDARLKQNMPKE